MPTIADFREVCERAARAGGQVLLDWSGKFQVREKGPADLVTEADFASQEVVQKTVLGAFPLHGFLAEENASIPSREQGYRWIVDPLDGTTNYVHGIPAFCVSVALEQAGELVVGAVFDPLAEQCFTAAVGQGATLNGRPLQVSTVERLRQAVAASSLPTNVQRESRALAELIEVTLTAQTVRRMGSSALNLCHLAAGRFDAYWSRDAKVWDIAAGLLLTREAGGIVTSPEGAEFRLDPPHFVAAATPALHRELMHTLGQAKFGN